MSTGDSLRPGRQNPLLRHASALADSSDRWFLSIARDLRAAACRACDPIGLVVARKAREGHTSTEGYVASARRGSRPILVGAPTSPSAFPGSPMVADFLASQLELLSATSVRSEPISASTHRDSGGCTALPIARPEAIGKAVERTVRHFVACDGVRLDLQSGSTATSSARRLDRDSRSRLVAPVTFGGVPIAALRVWRESGHPRFSTYDATLLRTVANQAAVALALASACSESEERRKLQAEIWRRERALLVDTMATEIADEVRCPINFFRSFFQPGSSVVTVGPDEIDIGCEEVARLDRLALALRRLSSCQLDRQTANMNAIVAGAVVLVHDDRGGPPIDVPAIDNWLRCDPELMSVAIVHLLWNAKDATSTGGSVGITWTLASSGAELAVWDSGSGIEGDLARLFSPWFSTKASVGGMGLPMVHRIVRAHGWSIDAQRREGKTTLTISIPSTDLVHAAPRG